MHPKDLEIKNFTYNLPPERIASHPLEQRDHSKLLIYRNKTIEENTYKNIASYLPEESMIVFNDTKVIPARILFKKDTGAVIEIFCLEPYGMEKDYATVMSRRESSEWKAMIGGAAKWKSGPLRKMLRSGEEEIMLEVSLTQKLDDAYVARFTWNGDYSFAEIIHMAGAVPLPPYIKRKAEHSDEERYQTIYANFEGSVAAPTAGLHFSESILKDLDKKTIKKCFVTLHVGAGTFKPVKAEKMQDHHMHAEWLDVKKETISDLLENKNQLTAVGTTATRTLESLYWMGVKTILNNKISSDEIAMKQWEAYDHLDKTSFTKNESLSSLLAWMNDQKLERIFCQTEIIIAPGYTFKMIDAMVTNFHQPNSTLLLLVAAAVGDDWKKIYDYALAHDFRFLSYGDGTLMQF